LRSVINYSFEIIGLRNECFNVTPKIYFSSRIVNTPGRGSLRAIRKIQIFFITGSLVDPPHSTDLLEINHGRFKVSSWTHEARSLRTNL